MLLQHLTIWDNNSKITSKHKIVTKIINGAKRIGCTLRHVEVSVTPKSLHHHNFNNDLHGSIARKNALGLYSIVLYFHVDI